MSSPLQRSDGPSWLAPREDLLARSAMPPPWASPDRVLYDGSLVRIGAFRAHPSHPLFDYSGPITEPIFVFPRTAVLLEYRGARPFPTSPNVVTYYNVGQLYRRQAIDPAGDHCEWFALHPELLLEVMRHLDPAVDDHPERPFRFHCGPGDARSYLCQRLVVRHLAQGGAADELAIEEAAMYLLFRTARAALGAAAREEAVRPAHRELAQRLRLLLGGCFHENRSLAELAAEIRCSPFYLARIFRAVDGRSIHQYRLQQRLSRSLERVAVGEELGDVAHDLGFSSHSHFTAAFRRAFGLTPSRLRASASSALLRSLLPARRVPLREALASTGPAAG
jgi:AraC family transcriptional regulator